MLRRALLGSLLSLLFGCADELELADARRDGGLAPHTSTVDPEASAPSGDAADAASPLGSAEDAAAPALDAQADSRSAVLLAASIALSGTSWISPLSPINFLVGLGPEFIQLGFLSDLASPGGTFVAFCPGACFVEQTDGGAVSGAPIWRETLTGRYTLFHITDNGTVYGALYTEDGLNFAMHFQVGRVPLSEIRVDWVVADIRFTRNSRPGP